VIGGTGRIGTAVAAHLLSHASKGTALNVVLAGRSEDKGATALDQVQGASGGAEALADRGHALAFQKLDYKDPDALERVLVGGVQGGFDACVHTAGPFFDGPGVLRSCIKTGTKVLMPSTQTFKRALR